MEKKKHPILKGVLVGVAVVLVILAIHFMRNYVIITQISEKQAELQNKQNYYYMIESNDGDTKVVTKYYYKDGKYKVIIDAGEDKKMIVWRDEETKEEILLIPHASQAIISKYEIASNGKIPSFINEYCNNIIPIAFITSDIVDGKECYRIRWSSAQTFVDKEEGTVLKTINGKTVIDGKEYDSITNIKDWKFGELTDEDLARPDLTGYEVKNNEQ